MHFKIGFSNEIRQSLTGGVELCLIYFRSFNANQKGLFISLAVAGKYIFQIFSIQIYNNIV